MGLGLGARMIHQRMHDPSLSSTETAFLDSIAPVFTDLEAISQESLYLEGTSRLLRADRFSDVSELNQLMDVLERRVTLLGELRAVLSEVSFCSMVARPSATAGYFSISRLTSARRCRMTAA